MDYVRTPTVAGMFYPETKEALINDIEHCFLDAPGPGLLPEPSKQNTGIFGVIVPHAGYSCSGAIAAYSYKAIVEAGFADAFILLGPNHHGIGSNVALSPHDSWQTPLGNTPVDYILKQTLKGDCIDLDDTAYMYQENSIEVQLPFLQYCGKNHSFSIAPIVMVMQDYPTSYEVGERLAKVIQKDTRRICIIASSDFSHEGFSYGHMPPKGVSVNEFVRKQDALVIDHILNMDTSRLIETIQQKRITMCGYGPVLALLTAAKILQKTSVELLKYGTSYDVYPDSNACVGYAAFVIH
jgi:AmmeMemoRadiSam system protein B